MKHKMNQTVFVVLCLLAFATGGLVFGETVVQAKSLAEQYAEAAKLSAINGNLETAIELARRARTADAENPEYIELEAHLLAQLVKRYYDRRSEVPTEAYRLTLNLYDAANELSERKNASDSVLKRRYYDQVELASYVGDENTVQVVLKRLLQRFPDDVRGNYLLGILLRNHYNVTGDQGSYEASRALFERAVLNNRAAEHLIPYAYFYVGTSRYDAHRDQDAMVYLTLWLRQIREVKPVLNDTDEFYVELAEWILDDLK